MTTRFKEQWVRKASPSRLNQWAREYERIYGSNPGDMDIERMDSMDDTTLQREINAMKIRKPVVTKEIVQKPGASTHTDKWDRCVEHVKANSPGVNAYAVCTSQLGSGSFKSMGPIEKMELVKAEAIVQDRKFFDVILCDNITHKIVEHLACAVTSEEANAVMDACQGKANELYYLEVVPQDTYAVGDIHKDVGIAFAGPTPSSLLARQDLEGTTRTKFRKGVLEQTGKKILQIAAKADEVDGTKEKEGVISDLTRSLKRRQKATIAERAKETGKSFKDYWKLTRE